MGSGAETTHETVDALTAAGEKVGVLKVRLYRPFAADAFLAALPRTVKSIAVLDRTKEPGALGEPLYQDVLTALTEAQQTNALPFAFPRVVGGRYGLSSKEFTPAMVRGVFDELSKAAPKNHFTVGIVDDVTHSSLDYDAQWTIADKGTFQGMFFGLGADGTVGANKNSIKIIGENTDSYAQGYFVYDSKKSGSMTISHLRFGKKPIRASYLIQNANFVACHQCVFLEKYDMLAKARPGAVFLLNTQAGPEEVWDTLPRPVQADLARQDASSSTSSTPTRWPPTRAWASASTRSCRPASSRSAACCRARRRSRRSRPPSRRPTASAARKSSARTTPRWTARWPDLHEVTLPAAVTSTRELAPAVAAEAPAFVREVTARIIAGFGDDLPVSAFPPDGSFPTDTARWEKRTIALEVPVWDSAVCIQCNKCALICPHAAIRPKVYAPAALAGAPASFRHTEAKGKELAGFAYTLQVAAEDCTGCGLCVHVCPAKNKSEVRLKAINMEALTPIRERERANFDFFLGLPEADRRQLTLTKVKDSQFLRPLFEFSGACGGCGETPYVKLVTQLFGDRMVVANATGCSSIYGGNLPTTPWAQDAAGRGPAWCNSLFEDNAEFGLGFRLSIDKQSEMARELLGELREAVDGELADALLAAPQKSEADIHDQRERVLRLRASLDQIADPRARRLADLADMLVKKSVWIMGGDGWAYDIGYGGLDHVLASGRNVNVLVLDTEVYSNTGGQMSKATPMGAVAKFAAGGKPAGKKDLGMMAMSYGNVYVAQIAMGASDAQTVRALVEAEAYDGPSLIIAYSHCIAHGIDMGKGTDNQKAAVQSGHWLLYRYNPERAAAGENPLQLDSKAPTMALKDYVYQETRYKMLTKSKPEASATLVARAQAGVHARWHLYEQLAGLHFGNGDGDDKPAPTPSDE